MGKNEKFEEIETYAGESIDTAVEKLLEAKKEGKHAYCKFNDVILDSDTVTLDSAYIEIVGCTKKEHEERIRKGAEEARKRRFLEEKEAVERIPDKIKRGKRLVYPFRYSDWASIVAADATGMYTGLITEDSLTIMEAIEEEMPVKELVKMFENQAHSGWSASLTRSIVMKFSKNGYPFYKATHCGEWTIDEYDYLLKIMKENEEANENLQLRLAMGAADSKREVINKQKRLIKQLENNSNM